MHGHIELLHCFLARREDIVERIQGLLNAQRKPTEYLRDGALLSRQFEQCFFTLPAITQDQSRLQGQLDAARAVSGFQPRRMAGLYNDLVDPAEMMMRGFHLWQQTRWPGRAGRVRYAHTLFHLYVMRCLELLSLRLWDDEPRQASDRLSQMQGVLDSLWTGAPADQPVLVRDARWLIQLAQSPATDDLSPYFDVAQHVVETLSQEDRTEIHQAGVRMTGGHLRSQIRYYSMKEGVSLDEHSLILNTRHGNALDFALLIQELVPLLEAYEHAWQSGDTQTRLRLGDAICQGVSPDPELFLNQVELLGAYSMIEHLFIATDREGHAVLTPAGRRHVQLFQEYDARIRRVAKPLADDSPRFRPVAGTASPYGLLYGFTTNLIEHMAFKTLQPDAVTRFSLEDVFTSGDDNSDKLAWIRGWRKLPHLTREVAALFDYPQQFAEDAYARVERALRTHASNGDAGVAARPGRLFVVTAGDRHAHAETASIPDLPVEYIRSSDRELVAAHKAKAYDETELLRERREGKFVLSYQTPGGWVGISKALLTEVVGAGRDGKITGLSQTAADALTLVCPSFVMFPENAEH